MMIRKSLFLSLLLFFAFLQGWSLDRPKVAVVLAGGGAKGMAHVAALKAIEEAGIPIDMVVGTSMGSIIGALYCAGYSPDSMSVICGSENWIRLIADSPDYGDERLSTRKDNEQFMLRVSVDPSRRHSSTGRGGVLPGKNVMRFFQRLLHHVPDSISFDELPVPFACVATNAVTGDMKVFRSGNLPMSMRASMAIPGVFTPVRINGATYIDGFVVDNFPVDVAKSMGADIIIGVDLVVPISDAQLSNSGTDILMRVMDLVSMERYHQNIRDCSIYIPIDVTGYSAASFGSADIDSLLHRGSYYASLKRPELDSLASVLALAEQPQRVRIGSYAFSRPEVTPVRRAASPSEKVVRSFIDAYQKGSVSLGGRFDNDEYASIHMAAHVMLRYPFPIATTLYGRLGQRWAGAINLMHPLGETMRVGFSHRYEHRDMRYYLRGKRAADVVSNHQRMQFYFGQEWRHVQYTFGLRHDWHHYTDIMMRQNLSGLSPSLDRTRYFSYFAQAEFNSLNSFYFPTHGSSLQASAELISDNLYKFGDHVPVPIVSGQWQSAFSFAGQRLTLVPHASARMILCDDEVPMALYNVVGGFRSGMKVSHQLTMAGVSGMEIMHEKAFVVAGLSLQHHLGRNYYFQGTVDVSSFGSQIDNALSKKGFSWGTQAAISYNSAGGPVSIIAYWSEMTKDLKLMVNVGYCF